MREEYRQGKIDDLLKPENKTERYKELEKKFDELINQQREILVKSEFDRVNQAQTEIRTFGILGESRVNVLKLNMALDALKSQ